MRTREESGHSADQRQTAPQPSAAIPAAQPTTADPAGARTPAGIIALQRTAGNAAVGGLLRRRPARAGSEHAIQRARLNVRAKGATREGTISGVTQWPSRPPSNLRSTQGQHRTAYVVFEDAILDRVADRTPAEAANELIALLQEYALLPGMAQKNVGYLEIGIAQCIKALTQAAADDDAAAVGEQIDVILAIRNQVPGTAARGDGGGHGEAAQSGVLTEVEKAKRTSTAFRADWGSEAEVADQVRYAMWRLLDYEPSAPADDVATAKIAKVVLTHYLALRSAYPQVWAWLSAGGMYLYDYLVNNRKAEGMPLTKLDGDELLAVFKIVYAGL